MLEDRLVNHRAEVDRIRHEEVLLAFFQQPIEYIALVQRVADVNVTWPMPLVLVVIRVLARPRDPPSEYEDKGSGCVS